MNCTDVTETFPATIETYNRQLRAIIDDAWDALHFSNHPPSLFRYGTKLAQVHHHADGRRVEFVDASNLRHRLDDIARWTRTTRHRLTNVRAPHVVVRCMLVHPDERLLPLDVELLPIRDGLGWVVFESASWTEFVLAWWSEYEDQALTPTKLATFCAANGFLSPVLTAANGRGAATRLGRALRAVRQRRHLLGGHMLIACPSPHARQSAYRLTCQLGQAR